MRDKNRIRPLMKKLKQCWEFTPDLTIYELLYNLYHDVPEKWTLYYQEDDFWMKNMEDYKLAHIADKVEVKLNQTQKEILNLIESIWEQNYDLRFSQMSNLILFTLEKNMDDLYALVKIQERLVGKNEK